MKKVPSISIAKLHKAALLLSMVVAFMLLFILPDVHAVKAPGTGPNPSPNPTGPPGGGTGDISPNNPIIKDIQTVIDFLSVGVAIVVIGAIIWGGIRYAMAGDSPEAISKAKQHIINALIALFAFIFLYAIVQWLVPGGVF